MSPSPLGGGSGHHNAGDISVQAFCNRSYQIGMNTTTVSGLGIVEPITWL